MEWGVKEHHVAVTALHKCRKSYSQIFELLKPSKILRIFMYWAIKRYKELWRVPYMARSGRLKSARADATIKTVSVRIHRNLFWKQKIMSWELNISTQSMLCLIRNNQHMRTHQHLKGQLLTPTLKEIWWTRAQRLLQWHAENRHENTIFLDEKIFTITEQ